MGIFSKDTIEEKNVEQLNDSSKDIKNNVAIDLDKNLKNTGISFRVLLNPVISEKATILGANNQYVFKVANTANRKQISDAIKNVYGVVPKKVNIIMNKGKSVRFRKFSGKRSNTKKAIVILRESDKIMLHEGV